MGGTEKKPRVNIRSGGSKTLMLLRATEQRIGENTISRRSFGNTGLMPSGLITRCGNRTVSAIAAERRSSGGINKLRRMLIIATIRKQFEESYATDATALSGFAKMMHPCYRAWRGI
jgi:hypothetical protein